MSLTASAPPPVSSVAVDEPVRDILAPKPRQDGAAAPTLSL
jgi:hypothetical protein